VRTGTSRGLRKAARKAPRLVITGTPGAGKSRVAQLLKGKHSVAEVGVLAVETGSGRKRRQDVEVNVAQLARWLRRHRRDDPRIVVGHLAHLLPIRDVVILRCHPTVLLERLAGRRDGGSIDLRENFVSEAMDLILFEARRRRRRIWEIDTTDRPQEAVAVEVERIFRTRPPPSYGKIDWLSDPEVTAHLLDR
jgi:adenylate kinase